MGSVALLDFNNYIELEHAMITPHANGETLLSGTPHIHIIFPQFATILLVVWSVTSDGSALTCKASSNVLYDDTYRCGCVIHLVGGTSRVRCALYKEILDLQCFWRSRPFTDPQGGNG